MSEAKEFMIEKVAKIREPCYRERNAKVISKAIPKTLSTCSTIEAVI